MINNFLVRTFVRILGNGEFGVKNGLEQEQLAGAGKGYLHLLSAPAS